MALEVLHVLRQREASLHVFFALVDDLRNFELQQCGRPQQHSRSELARHTSVGLARVVQGEEIGANCRAWRTTDREHQGNTENEPAFPDLALPFLYLSLLSSRVAFAI